MSKGTGVQVTWLNSVPRFLCAGIMVTAAVALHAIEPAAAAPTAKTIPIGPPVISVTNEQSDGSIWVLAARSGKKKLGKVDVSRGRVIFSESVTRRATAITQSTNGELALGTSNGKSSAVVLYGGAYGNFQSTVPMAAPVLDLAISPSGQFVYVLENSKPNRTLFVFDQTHRGLSYPVSKRAIAVAPVSDQSAAWILQSDGLLEKISFFPFKVVQRVKLQGRGTAIAESPDGSLLFALVSTASQRVVVMNSTGGRATVIVPHGSGSIGVSTNGNTLFDSVSDASSGIVVAIPL